MERKEAICGAYRLTGGNNFYDGMITCSTLSGNAVCRLLRAMNKAECDDYPGKALSGILENFSGRLLEVAMRQNDIAFEVRDYLKAHPKAAVANLGCGLDGTGRACDNGSYKIYNLDFPNVIAVRNELLPAVECEENIPCDLNYTA